MRSLALAVVTCIGTAGIADAATFAQTGSGIRMTGDIKQGDAEQLRSLLGRLDKAGVVIAQVTLDSPGGDSRNAVEMADMIREKGFRTVVGAAGYCASACVTMFAGGLKRAVFSDSILGVHSARMVVKDANGNDVLVDNKDAVTATVELARKMKKLGAPASVVGKMLSTPGASIAWLDAADLAAWHVEVIGGDYDPFSPAERVSVLVRTSPGWMQILLAIVLSGAASFAGGAALFAAEKMLRRAGNKRMRWAFA